MPDRVTIHIPSFPQCPDCGAQAHELTFRPVVRQVDGQTDEGPTVYDERELIDFAWRCPNDHLFATAIDDIELNSWQRLTERPGHAHMIIRFGRSRRHSGTARRPVADFLPKEES